MSYELNETIVKKILSTVDCGLSKGKGEPVPGHMCVEAAVCFAFGLPHSDNPPCVGPAVRAFKIELNDAQWSSDMARANGLRTISIAQLGSEKLDQNEFSKLLAERTIRIVLPIALRNCGWEKEALRCEAEGTAEAAYAASYAAACASTNAAACAAQAAQAAYAASYAAARASTNAAACAAAKVAYATKAATNATKADEILSLSAKIAVEILIEMDCEGTKWLHLCNEPKENTCA